MRARIFLLVLVTSLLLVGVRIVQREAMAVSLDPSPAPSSNPTLLSSGGVETMSIPDSGIWHTYTYTNTAGGLVDNYVLAVTIDGSGNKWFGTAGGVSVLGSAGWYTYTTAHGLASNAVRNIVIEGTIKWFGTSGGVSKFDGTTWITYTTTHGLANDLVLAVAIDESGHKWFGTWSGVSEFDGESWHTYLGGYPVEDIAIEGANRWFTLWSGGVRVFDGATWTTYQTGDGLASNYTYAVTIDGDGNKWFCTLAGLSVLDDNGTPANKADDTWQTFTTADGLVNNNVQVIAIDTDGRKWFGYASHEGDGVSVLDDNGTPANKADDTWQTFTTADGLVNNDVLAIAIGGGGNWFGTVDGVSEYIPYAVYLPVVLREYR